jgi:[CysO sulfur-carrier protein]-S-L-cysteine hydrolase
MRIRRDIYDEIVARAQTAAPLEACGYLATVDEVVVAQHQLKNTDASGEHFTMDPAEQFATIKKIRAETQKVAAVWHSHPATPARPSAEDIRLALDPNILYVIVSLAAAEPVMKAFRIRDGTVEPQAVEVIEPK